MMNKPYGVMASAWMLCIIIVAHGNADEAKVASSVSNDKQSITLVVMDPLAAPLACACVQGYANRQYQRLSEYLEEKLNTRVRIFWSSSLEEAITSKTDGQCDLVIGKDSVVRSQAKLLKRNFVPIAALSGLDGKTTQHGLFVVRTNSPIASLLDLEDSQVFFGQDECDEKWNEPRSKLKSLEITVSDKSTSLPTCSSAAKKLLELPEDEKAAAVISSYAAPLLEGCGTIKKGDLRVIGKTDEIRFISVFANASLDEKLLGQIKQTLLELKTPSVLESLETAKGFSEYTSVSAP